MKNIKQGIYTDKIDRPERVNLVLSSNLSVNKKLEYLKVQRDNILKALDNNQRDYLLAALKLNDQFKEDFLSGKYEKEMTEEYFLSFKSAIERGIVSLSFMSADVFTISKLFEKSALRNEKIGSLLASVFLSTVVAISSSANKYIEKCSEIKKSIDRHEDNIRKLVPKK